MKQVSKRLFSVFAIAVMAVCFVQPSFAKKPWKEGKILFSASDMVDGYKMYKVVLSLGDGQAALLWNHAGTFAEESSNDCPGCRAFQMLIQSMFEDCQETRADICQHQQPVRYRLDNCMHGRVQCIGIDLPLIPSKGMNGPHETLWVDTLIRPAEEVMADMRHACMTAFQQRPGDNCDQIIK